MAVIEAEKARRLLVRLDDGEDLLRAVEAIVEEQAIGRGWVRGVGRLSSVELAGIDAPGQRPAAATRVEGPMELLSLEGSIGSEDGVGAVALFVSVAAAGEQGPRVTGGRVRRAEVRWAEIVFEAFSGAPAQRRASSPPKSRASAERPTPERAVAKAAWADVGAMVEDRREPEPVKAQPSWADVAAASEPVKKAGPSWADVAAASEPAEEDWAPAPAPGRRGEDHRAPPPPDLSEKPSMALPIKGDFVQHRQFGVCRVDREDGNGGIVIRLASGVRKTIKLSYMEVGAPRQDGRRTIFPIRPRKKK